MIAIRKFTFNPFQENTYVVSNEDRKAWIIDPGNQSPVEDQQLIDYIEEKQLEPEKIINTHAHLDHIFGNRSLYDAFQLPVVLHKEDRQLYQSAPEIAVMYGLPPFHPPEVTEWLGPENEELRLGEERFQILFTPGHAPGEISLYHEESKQLIAGDVLFYEGIGRTDLPGGDYPTLINSIKTQFWPLPDDVKVYCGHGPDTTIGHEKNNNPFLIED